MAEESAVARGAMREATAPYCLRVAEPSLGPKQWLGGGSGFPPYPHCPPSPPAFGVLWLWQHGKSTSGMV